MMLLYTQYDWAVGGAFQLRVKVGGGASLQGLVDQPSSYPVAYDVAQHYPNQNPAPARTFYAVMDNLYNVYVAYQSTNGNIHGIKLNAGNYSLPRTPFELAIGATLDGLAIDSYTVPNPTLYLSYHDAASIPHVLPINAMALGGPE